MPRLDKCFGRHDSAELDHHGSFLSPILIPATTSNDEQVLQPPAGTPLDESEKKTSCRS
jgi:hypothetical protein